LCTRCKGNFTTRRSAWNVRSALQMTRRMVASGMLRRVALVRTDVSEELRASFISVTRIGELRTTLAVTSNQLLVTASVVRYAFKYLFVYIRNAEGKMTAAVCQRSDVSPAHTSCQLWFYTASQSRRSQSETSLSWKLQKYLDSKLIPRLKSRVNIWRLNINATPNGCCSSWCLNVGEPFNANGR
jgi:hypothetical protein